METLEERFEEIWIVDFEYKHVPGDPVEPICMVAIEYKTGRKISLWLEGQKNGGGIPSPFIFDSKTLFIAYYALAEFSCFLALGWELPYYVLDFYVEFKRITNGAIHKGRHSLLDALLYFSINHIEDALKEEMRQLAMRGGPWTDNERVQLLTYCETDVIALQKIFPRISKNLSINHALLRGEYIRSLSVVENNGTPVDKISLILAVNSFPRIIDTLIKVIDAQYGVYEAKTFKLSKFEAYLIKNNILWPQNSNGRLLLDEDTFKSMSKLYPDLNPLRELRAAISQMRLNKLEIGRDGRNRCSLSPFQAKTSRNAPSTNKFIFGPSAWFRFFIKHESGTALAYIDWSQQEVGIAAALSKDENLKKAYISGDPYLEFAKQAGAVPTNGTKRTHPVERNLYKQCVLAVQYGMGEESLAKNIGRPIMRMSILFEGKSRGIDQYI